MTTIPVNRNTLERVLEALEYLETESDAIPVDVMALHEEVRALLAEKVEPKPVAYRAWFDADNGARWLFTLWPDEEGGEDFDWQPLYTREQL